MKNRRDQINDDSMYEYFEQNARQLFKAWPGERTVKRKSHYKLTRDSMVQIYKSLQVLYEEEEKKEEICLIENTFEILDDYIQIEGMEQLLINNYAVIENAIFLEHTSQGTPKRIREHYKHQFRNAYLGLMLLDQYHVDESVISCLQAGNNEYSHCLQECIFQEKGADISEEQLKDEWKEMVYKCYYISALFHDIGYPLAYYFRIAKEIHQFTPFFRIVNPAVKTSFAEIRAILNNSWLFKTVDYVEIDQKYQADDHGCLSAISFLMNFYFSGIIYSLSPKKRGMVEMAAVAIYKHTNHYGKNHRMIFSQDPISYLVRMCDDLQEWQRFFVLIGDTHNYLQCMDCGDIVRPSEIGAEYICKCGKQFKKITQIRNRKLNYVDICSGVRLKNSDHGKSLQVFVDYDCYRLLELLLWDYEAVIYRKKALDELESMLHYQKYLPSMELNYFLSNNPIKIIERMISESGKTEEDIQRWIDQNVNETYKNNLQVFFQKYLEELANSGSKYGKKVEKNAVRFARQARKFVTDYMGEIYSLWQFLNQET